ncbi:MAG: WbqC family protein [Thalassotalea sp.]
MKLAIMQPYLFPYLGYFQLINTVDKFVIYDDVNYIKRGWVNRNRILVNGLPFMFTLPIHKPSQNTYIKNTNISSNYLIWQKKFRKTIVHAYRNAEFFDENVAMIDKILKCEKRTLSSYIENALKIICQALAIETKIVLSSNAYTNTHLKAQERIVDICKQENANMYINAIGGLALYQSEQFEQHNIELQFLKSHEIEYQQMSEHYVPYLSILDQLMYTGLKKTKNSLAMYSLTS